MKAAIFSFWLLLVLSPAHAEDVAKMIPFSLEFHDPRQTVSFYPWIENGEERSKFSLISNSILLICWSPAPNGAFERYQISGLDGYHTKEQRFLTAFYELDQRKGVGMTSPMSL